MCLPDVSVIVTCYNYGRYLERCLRSLFNQNYTNTYSYEVIVIDDGSDDNTPLICSKFSEKFDNLIVIRNAKNIGLQLSCNLGIGIANGRYIVRVDADDYVSRHFLFFLKYAMDKNRKYQAFSCDYMEVDIFENIIRQCSFTEEQLACAIMYRKEFLIDIGMYDADYKYREGHEMNKRFLEKYKIGNLPIPLYFVRKHELNRSKDEEIKVYDQKLTENV